MLKTEQIKRGAFYRTNSGKIIYVLNFTFQDYVARWGANPLTPGRHDYIVYRILERNTRYDYAFCEFIAILNATDDMQLEEEVEVPIVFIDGVHYLECNNFLFTYDAICGPSVVKDSIKSQCMPYKFHHRLMLGAECTKDKSNIDFSKESIDSIIKTLFEIVGTENFVYYKHLSIDNVGRVVTTGFSFWFNSEENYNIACLCMPFI